MNETGHPLIGLTLNYREAARTNRCITSLLDDGAHGVLVWDNSEDNGTSARALRESWADDPRVDIFVSNHNLGFAAGVNRGIETALRRWPTAWIMLINNDAALKTGALDQLVSTLTEQPQAVVSYPRINHGGREIGTLYYQRHFALMTFDKPIPGSFPYPSGAALLIAPERVTLPLLDEDFFMYGEDVLLGWRLGRQRMAHVPRLLVWHEASATARNGSLFYETRIVAAHWLLARKLARSRTDELLLLVPRWISLSARALLRAARTRSSAPLLALWNSRRAITHH